MKRVTDQSSNRRIISLTAPVRPTLDASGAASLTVTSLAVGSHNLTASYGGNANFQNSTSTAVGQVVNAASTTAVLTSSPWIC